MDGWTITLLLALADYLERIQHALSDIPGHLRWLADGTDLVGLLGVAARPIETSPPPAPVVRPVGSQAARGAEVRAEIARVPRPGEPLPNRSIEGWIGVTCRLRDHAESLLDENEQLRAEVDRLRGLVERQLGNCIGCTTEPEETCPRDGRSYSQWVEIASAHIGQSNVQRERAEHAESELAAARRVAQAVDALIDQARKVSPSGSMTVYIGDLERALGRRAESVRGIVGADQ